MLLCDQSQSQEERESYLLFNLFLLPLLYPTANYFRQEHFFPLQPIVIVVPSFRFCHECSALTSFHLLVGGAKWEKHENLWENYTTPESFEGSRAHRAPSVAPPLHESADCIIWVICPVITFVHAGSSTWQLHFELYLKNLTQVRIEPWSPM